MQTCFPHSVTPLLYYLRSVIQYSESIWTFLPAFSFSFQTNTTTVIAAQPTTTTYVQPSSRRSNEAIPTIGLVFTIIHLVVCLSFGNLLIFGCLIPALICAIVVSLDPVHSHQGTGWHGLPANVCGKKGVKKYEKTKGGKPFKSCFFPMCTSGWLWVLCTFNTMN